VYEVDSVIAAYAAARRARPASRYARPEAMAKSNKKGDVGAALLARLDAWVKAFSRRPDVKVLAHKRGKPWKAAEGSIYAGPEIASFYGAANGYTFEWCPKDQPDLVSSLNIPSYTATAVVFQPFRPMGSFEAAYADAMLLDAVPSKNRTVAARPKPSSKSATILSHFTGRTFDSFDAYLTEGARAAFAKGWQWGDAATRAKLPWFPEGNTSWQPAETLRASLEARAPAADTPLEALRAQLIARSLSADEAETLSSWLGPDARVTMVRDGG
jgi:hypothetical protein